MKQEIIRYLKPMKLGNFDGIFRTLRLNIFTKLSPVDPFAIVGTLKRYQEVFSSKKQYYPLHAWLTNFKF